jgi:putative inorganic carbon (hco3(-)) transporter
VRLSRMSQGSIRLTVAAVALSAIVAGLLGGVNPAFAFAFAGGVVFLLVALANVWAGVTIFTLLIFIDVPRVGGNADLSMTKAAMVALVFAWLAAMAVRQAADRDLSAVHPGIVAALIAFLCWVGVSAVWAGSDAAVVRALLRYAPNAALFPVVYFAVRERRQLSWLMGAFVLGALLSALYGLFVTAGGASTAQAAEGRLTGATAEANELAALLVVATVFAVALAYDLRGRSRAWILAAGAAPLALVALFATLSRSGLIALAVALLAAIVIGGRWRGRLTLFAAMVTAIGVIYFAAASPTALERITNPSSSGRDDIWTVGWRIVEHNPVVGIGADNFKLETVRYLVEPGVISADQYIVSQPLVAHNVYLEMLAELGIVGLTLFVTIIGMSIACTVRATATARASGDPRLELLSRALIVGLVALLAADCFASEQYSKQLWLLLALGPVVLAASRRSAVAARRVSWRDELALLPRRVAADRVPIS